MPHEKQICENFIMIQVELGTNIVIWVDISFINFILALDSKVQMVDDHKIAYKDQIKR